MKNKTKKRAGIVAVALMLTVAIGATAGNTLAKYISSATVESQVATVAAWGYTLKADTSKMFSNQYGDVQGTPSTAVVSGDNLVVKSETGNNVVAPGTSGKMLFTVNGTAEVNAILTIDLSDFAELMTVSLTDGEGLKYYPINWYVGTLQVNEDNTAAPDTYDFAGTMKNYLVNVKGYEATQVAVDDNKVILFIPYNTSVSDLDLTISWDWAFETVKGEDGNYNIEDTLLGYKADKVAYDKISDNVKDWIIENYASGEYEAVNDKQDEITAKQGEITAKQGEITAKQGEIADKLAKVVDKEAEVAVAQNTVDRLEAITGYEDSKEYADAVDELDKLEGELAVLNGELEELQDELAVLNGELEELEGELEELEGELEELEGELKEAIKTAYEETLEYSIEINHLGIKATVEQTLWTAAEFSANYKLNPAA